ncbi:MAG: pyridoxal 5'-phosphate synthase glutaminase subunit PdxT [Conexivisphaerales archaeon]
MVRRIGVLGVQGDVEEHISAAKKAIEEERIDGEVKVVKTPQDVDAIDAIMLPGGESTAIGSLSALNGTLGRLTSRLKAGLPALGTCAGLILLARRTTDRVVGTTNQPLLGVLDVEVNRNAFGRQRESFETELAIPKLGDKPYHAVFIRAPVITSVGNGVEVLAKTDEGIVAVQQGNIIGTSFHPELSGDSRLHRYFLRLIDSAQ